MDAEREEKKRLSMKFGNHIRYLRKKKNITAAELSRRTFIDKPHISRIERGNSNPSLFTLKKIASGLRVTFKEMFEDFNE